MTWKKESGDLLSYVSFATIKRHWITVAAFSLIGAVVAIVLSSLMTPLYRSTAALYFTLNFGNSANELAQGSNYTANQMLSFGQLATSPVVLDPVIAQLDLPVTATELARTIEISTPRDTVIMEISAVSSDPTRAADIANAVATQSKVIIEEYAPQTENSKPTVTVRTIATAVPPQFQFSPDKRLNAVAGFGVGALGGVLAAFLLAVLDNRIRNADSLTGLSPVAYLGTLRRRTDTPGREAVVLQEPSSQAAEEYRQVRSSLRFATMSKHPLTLVVSSSVPGEGKTTVATNLAAVLAESGQRVLLVDADLRKPLIAQYTHAVESVGLSELLVDATTLSSAVQPLGLSGVDVLVAGATPPNPGELVASTRMAEVIREAQTAYDVIIIDTAPVLAVADALSLTALCDGMLIVARSRMTTKADLGQSLSKIRGAGGSIFGVVINGANVKSDRSLRDYQYGASAIAEAAAVTTAAPRTDGTGASGLASSTEPPVEPGLATAGGARTTRRPAPPLSDD